MVAVGRYAWALLLAWQLRTCQANLRGTHVNPDGCSNGRWGSVTIDAPDGWVVFGAYHPHDDNTNTNTSGVFVDVNRTTELGDSPLTCADSSSMCAHLEHTDPPNSRTFMFVSNQTFYFNCSAVWWSVTFWHQPVNYAMNPHTSQVAGPYTTQSVLELTLNEKGIVYMDMSYVTGVSAGARIVYNSLQRIVEPQATPMYVAHYNGIYSVSVQGQFDSRGQTCDCAIFPHDGSNCDSDVCKALCPSALADTACGQHECRLYYHRSFQDTSSYCSWLKREAPGAYCWTMGELECKDETCGYSSHVWGGPDNCSDPRLITGLHKDLPPDWSGCAKHAMRKSPTAEALWPNSADARYQPCTESPALGEQRWVGGNASLSFINLTWLAEQYAKEPQGALTLESVDAGFVLMQTSAVDNIYTDVQLHTRLEKSPYRTTTRGLFIFQFTDAVKSVTLYFGAERTLYVDNMWWTPNAPAELAVGPTSVQFHLDSQLTTQVIAEGVAFGVEVSYSNSTLISFVPTKPTDMVNITIEYDVPSNNNFARRTKSVNQCSQCAAANIYGETWAMDYSDVNCQACLEYCDGSQGNFSNTLLGLHTCLQYHYNKSDAYCEWLHADGCKSGDCQHQPSCYAHDMLQCTEEGCGYGAGDSQWPSSCAAINTSAVTDTPLGVPTLNAYACPRQPHVYNGTKYWGGGRTGCQKNPKTQPMGAMPVANGTFVISFTKLRWLYSS